MSWWQRPFRLFRWHAVKLSVGDHSVSIGTVVLVINIWNKCTKFDELRCQNWCIDSVFVCSFRREAICLRHVWYEVYSALPPGETQACPQWGEALPVWAVPAGMAGSDLYQHACCPPFISMSKRSEFCALKNFSRTDRLLRHRRLCQGRNVTKVENQPCCDPRPYPQEPPPAPPTWSPLHPPPGRLAVWHSAFPSSTMPPETDQATGSLPRSSVLCDTALGQALILQLQSWDY